MARLGRSTPNNVILIRTRGQTLVDGSFGSTQTLTAEIAAVRPVSADSSTSIAYSADIAVVPTDTPAPVVHDFTDRAVRTARLFRGNNFVAIRGGVRQSAPLDADGTFTVGIGFTADITLGGTGRPPATFAFTEAASMAAMRRLRTPGTVVQQRTRGASSSTLTVDGAFSSSLPLQASVGLRAAVNGSFQATHSLTADIAIVTGDLPAPNGVFDFTESASRRSSARFRGPTRVIQQRVRPSLSAVDGTLGMTLSFSSAISVIRPVAATFGMGVSFTATDSIVGVAGNVFVWNGTSWVPADLFVWNGSSWVAATTSAWNGSLWI